MSNIKDVPMVISATLLFFKEWGFAYGLTYVVSRLFSYYLGLSSHAFGPQESAINLHSENLYEEK